MSVMVKALGYYSHNGGKVAKGLSRAKDHLKYLEHGKVHEFKPKGFDDGRDDVSRAEFVQKLEAQPTRGVIAHKFVFSLSQEERDRLGINLKTLVRETMKAWGDAIGRGLSWIGFQHEDKGHPHVHVVVAGYAEGKQVGVYEKDLNNLREFAEREKGRQEDINRVAPERGGLERSAGEEATRLHSLTKDLERDLGRGR